MAKESTSQSEKIITPDQCFKSIFDKTSEKSVNFKVCKPCYKYCIAEASEQLSKISSFDQFSDWLKLGSDVKGRSYSITKDYEYKCSSTCEDEFLEIDAIVTNDEDSFEVTVETSESAYNQYNFYEMELMSSSERYREKKGVFGRKSGSKKLGRSGSNMSSSVSSTVNEETCLPFDEMLDKFFFDNGSPTFAFKNCLNLFVNEELKDDIWMQEYLV